LRRLPPIGCTAVTGYGCGGCPSGGSDVELEFWRSIKESKQAEELNAYLTNYPNRQFKSLRWPGSRLSRTARSTATRTLSPASIPHHYGGGKPDHGRPDRLDKVNAATCSAG